ncbi:MAG: hypothetical protein WC683_09330 [bacterium]
MKDNRDCYMCEGSGTYRDADNVSHPCICTLRPVRGHMEDCGWVDDPAEDEDREPAPEPEYDGPMPECEAAE